jgi:hypothetical protein
MIAILPIISILQSVQKLNREIDKHLKQPDDNKFATLKVRIFISIRLFLVTYSFAE